MAEAKKSTPLCYNTRYELLHQNVHGKNKIVDPYDYPNGKCDVSGQLEKLTRMPELPEYIKNSFRHELNGPEIKAMVAYTTTKEEKIEPLRAVVDKHKQDIERHTGKKIKIIERQFEVKNTGVGEQPYHPNGLFGAVNRIGEVKKFLLGRNEWEAAWKMGREPLHLTELVKYDRIIIVSMESDIVDRNDSDKVPYDKPNIIFYERVTGKMVSGMGRGPGCQRELLQLAKEMGLVLTKSELGVTYGNVLMLLFSGQKSVDGRATVKFKASDWHRVVLPGGQNRAFFVTELCELMEKALAGFFEKCLL